jgi:hypothetical protein
MVTGAAGRQRLPPRRPASGERSYEHAHATFATSSAACDAGRGRHGSTRTRVHGDRSVRRWRRRSTRRSIDDRPNLVRTSNERRHRAPRRWRPRLTDDSRSHARRSRDHGVAIPRRAEPCRSAAGLFAFALRTSDGGRRTRSRSAVSDDHDLARRVILGGDWRRRAIGREGPLIEAGGALGPAIGKLARASLAHTANGAIRQRMSYSGGSSQGCVWRIRHVVRRPCMRVPAREHPRRRARVAQRCRRPRLGQAGLWEGPERRRPSPRSRRTRTHPRTGVTTRSPSMVALSAYTQYPGRGTASTMPKNIFRCTRCGFYAFVTRLDELLASEGGWVIPPERGDGSLLCPACRVETSPSPAPPSLRAASRKAD